MSENDKPWYDLETMESVYARGDIKTDEDVASYFNAKGYDVSRRAITDARNSLGIPAKTKTFDFDHESPKVLFIDIETRPNLGYFWRLYDENIGINQLVDEHQLLCFAAKWLGERKIEFYSEKEHGRVRMVHEAHRLLDEADVVIHWNGQKFDIPHLNREFVLNGLNPPSSFKQLDLLLTARSRFKFASNKLQHISTALGLEGKFEHEGFDLWVKCMAGEDKAWKTMKKYNKQDVVLLEQIYEKILPWIKGHPNVPLYRGEGKCPHCGSNNITHVGETYTNLRSYHRYQCQDCGTWMRGNKFVNSTGLMPITY